MKPMDLHMHSKYSDDGQYEPEELLQMCKDADLSIMAIADHNSVKGSRIAVEKAKDYGIFCVPAIEIDAQLGEDGYHILGYGIDVSQSIFDEIEENVVKQELQASGKRMALVKQLGILFSEERIRELAPDGIVTGEIIAEAAMEEKDAPNNPLLQPYFPGGARSDNPYVNFYWDFCAPGKPAYVEIVYPSVAEIVHLLHEQQALAIVAHPGQNVKEDPSRMQALLALGVDGMEVYSSYHSPQQKDYYYQIAKEHGLLMTCGSDFHGKTKPSVHIGQCVMDEEQQEILYCRLRKLLAASR